MTTQTIKDRIILDWIKDIHQGYANSLEDLEYSEQTERFLSDLNNATSMVDVKEAVNRFNREDNIYHTPEDLRVIARCSYLLQHFG